MDVLLQVETEHAYLFDGNYSWTEAKRACTLIGSQPLVNISTSRNHLGWINEAASYSPWLEYLGCFRIREKQIVNVTTVDAGTQMKECLLLCENYFFIGLQQSRCACLMNTSIDGGHIYERCNAYSSANCQRDHNAMCAVNNSVHKFALYKKVVINGNIGIGDCLTVISNRQRSIFYWASRCDLKLFQICSTDRVFSPASVTISEKEKVDRASSATKCKYKFLASYASATQGNLQLSLEKYYWLDNTRRHFFQSVNQQQPEYCVAAKTDRNGRMIKEIRDCNTKLPALCSGSEFEVVDVNTKQSSIHDILVIALIITATATCLMVVVVVLLFCRLKRSSLKHALQPLAEIEKEVVYAQVDKSTKSTTKKHGDRDKTLANDCDDYDHANHFFSPNVLLVTDNTYDTMQSIERGEENNYNCAHEAEKHSPVIIDNDEYSAIENITK